ncbi:UNKNOWN [Stylonychia lemnae]|uniref:Uncharacterized protein n=1 Tax=Stylonychia lemnae TaxID=5949 RepID=A0A078ATR3_STYLE|nr:UNKNOWN [Stylonychia lemnae]|eukprot:CDW85634.1 UNKNOWN [Stylonychia lemnae]
MDKDLQVTIIYVDYEVDNQFFVYIPRYNTPLQGIFTDVDISIQNPNDPTDFLILRVTCFLTKSRSNYTSLGHNGYLGLAPMRKDDKSKSQNFSFIYQLKNSMKIQKNLAIKYSIYTTQDLGLNKGSLEFYNADDDHDLKISKDYSTKIKANLTNSTLYQPLINSTFQYYSYFNESFLFWNCYFRYDGMRMCRCRGNSFEGMPNIQLISQKFSYLMEPSDYLLYPTIETVKLLMLIYARIIERRDVPQRCRTQAILSLKLGTKISRLDKHTLLFSTQYFWLILAMNLIPNFMFISKSMFELYQFYYFSGDTNIERSLQHVITMLIFLVVMIALITLFTKGKQSRLKIQYQRWKDIKELEDDYDVYVSDEYAYHITDLKVQMDQLQSIENYTNGQENPSKSSLMSINGGYANSHAFASRLQGYSQINKRQQEQTNPNSYGSGVKLRSSKRTGSVVIGSKNSDSFLES